MMIWIIGMLVFITVGNMLPATAVTVPGRYLVPGGVQFLGHPHPGNPYALAGQAPLVFGPGIQFLTTPPSAQPLPKSAQKFEGITPAHVHSGAGNALRIIPSPTPFSLPGFLGHPGPIGFQGGFPIHGGLPIQNSFPIHGNLPVHAGLRLQGNFPIQGPFPIHGGLQFQGVVPNQHELQFQTTLAPQLQAFPLNGRQSPVQGRFIQLQGQSVTPQYNNFPLTQIPLQQTAVPLQQIQQLRVNGQQQVPVQYLPVQYAGNPAQAAQLPFHIPLHLTANGQSLGGLPLRFGVPLQVQPFQVIAAPAPVQGAKPTPDTPETAVAAPPSQTQPQSGAPKVVLTRVQLAPQPIKVGAVPVKINGVPITISGVNYRRGGPIGGIATITPITRGTIISGPLGGSRTGLNPIQVASSPINIPGIGQIQITAGPVPIQVGGGPIVVNPGGIAGSPIAVQVVETPRDVPANQVEQPVRVVQQNQVEVSNGQPGKLLRPIPQIPAKLTPVNTIRGVAVPFRSLGIARFPIDFSKGLSINHGGNAISRVVGVPLLGVRPLDDYRVSAPLQLIAQQQVASSNSNKNSVAANTQAGNQQKTEIVGVLNAGSTAIITNKIYKKASSSASAAASSKS